MRKVICLSVFQRRLFEKVKESDRKWCHHAYQQMWLHSFTVSWDGFADGWQTFSLGPQFGTLVKASKNGDDMLNEVLAAFVHTQVEQQFIVHLVTLKSEIGLVHDDHTYIDLRGWSHPRLGRSCSSELSWQSSPALSSPAAPPPVSSSSSCCPGDVRQKKMGGKERREQWKEGRKTSGKVEGWLRSCFVWTKLNKYLACAVTVIVAKKN